MKVRSGETPGSRVVKPPCVAERWGAKRGGATGRSAASSEGCGVVIVHRLRAAKEEPSPSVQGEGHGTHPRTWSGCGRTSRRNRAWNGQKVVLGTGETLSAPSLRGAGVRRPISGSTAKWSAAERESKGAVVVTMGGTTQPARSEGPLIHRCTRRKGGTLMSADRTARSVSHAEGVDKVRALQRVLYRSATQDPTRRFHALHDSVSIADIDAGGVEGQRVFLEQLATELRAGNYRPPPLRRPRSSSSPSSRPTLGLRDRNVSLLWLRSAFVVVPGTPRGPGGARRAHLRREPGVGVCRHHRRLHRSSWHAVLKPDATAPPRAGPVAA